MFYVENFMILPDVEYEPDSYYEEQDEIFHVKEDREWEDLKNGG